MQKPSQSEGYRIIEHIGLASFESIRPQWEQWQTHPNADLDFFSTIVKNRRNVVNPIALVIYKNEAPVALAACRLEKAALPMSFGYFKVSGSDLLQLTVVYGGLMGAWDELAAAVFIRHLRHMMQRDHIDAVHFAAMRHDHPVYITAHRVVPFFLRDIALKNNLHWWADLPDTFEGYLKKINRKHRAQLRSKERKLTEYCGAAIQSKIYRLPGDVAAFCSIAEKIAQTTYLRGLGEGFYDTGEMRDRLDLSSRKGWMRGYVLSANEKPCAFWLGTLYRNIFYLDYTGFDPDLKDYGAGQILFIKMIEDLCEACTARAIDFGSGDAVYKQRYGDRTWKESDVYIFNGTPAMVVTNLTRKSVSILRTAAEQSLKRLDLLGKIKKRWRLTAQKAVTVKKNVEEDGEPAD